MRMRAYGSLPGRHFLPNFAHLIGKVALLRNYQLNDRSVDGGGDSLCS